MIWHASPEIFSLGFLHVRWYGLFFAVGFLIGFYMMAWLCEKENLPTERLDSLLVYLIVGTIVGARLGHCLIYEPGVYLRDPIRILKVWEGGLASHGGGVGVILAVWLWIKRTKFPASLLRTLDYLCIPTMLIGSMIRLGNFFNSEIIGKPSNVPWAVVFARVDPRPRHPAQLYESLAYFLTFLLLLAIFRKGWHKGRTGLLLGVFLTLTFVERFLIEFVKERQVAFENQMTLDLGQLLSIPFILMGLFLIFRAIRAGRDVKKPKISKARS